MGLRDTLNSKPWIGWVVAGVAIVFAALLLIRNFAGSGPVDSATRRAQTVTIRCTESGNEWTMNRGQFEQMLMTTPGQIDTAGIPSPYADGRPVAVLVDTEDWESTVERINAVKKMYQGRKRGG